MKKTIRAYKVAPLFWNMTQKTVNKGLAIHGEKVIIMFLRVSIANPDALTIITDNPFLRYATTTDIAANIFEYTICMFIRWLNICMPF